MKKPELLAPAGDLKTFKVALQSGADAVYVGGKCFSARSFALNLSNEELAEATIYAHQRNKRIYVTINTIIDQKDFMQLNDFLSFLNKINVDAVIVQDLGIIRYIRCNYPNIEVHASTQMNIFNQKALEYLINLGVKRVVLARELNIKQIEKLSSNNIELEVFVHGALCFSCSGNCLMSYSIGNRSGNKGKCAQPCRKKYQLIENGLKISKAKALLSMKDLCTIENIDQLIKSNVKSFKIEGRMKSPEYVYTVVKTYRKGIDDYFQNLQNDDSNQLKEMKLVFNREFTKGYLFQESNEKLTNVNFVNHQGIFLGKIIKTNNNFIEIKLEEDLMIHDAIRIVDKEEIGFDVQIMYVDGNKRKIAYKGEIVKIPLKTNNNLNNQKVLLTKSEKIKQDLNQYLESEHVKSPINLKFKIQLNDYAMLTIDDGTYLVKVYSNNIITNINEKPKEDNFYIEKLNKFVDTPFYIANIKIENDQKAFISVKDLNEMRKKATEQLLIHRLNLRKVNQNQLISKNFKQIKLPITFEVIVHNQKQYDACKKMNIKNIYTDYESELMNVTRLSDKVYDNHLVHNLGQIGKNVTISPYFNITNLESIKMIANYQPKIIYMSYETNLNDLDYLSNLNLNIGFPIYGKMDVMVTKHCMIAKEFGYKNKHCGKCLNNEYKLLDEYQNQFLIFTEENCNLRIIDYKIFNIISQLEKLKKLGFNCFLLTFTDETPKEIENILSLLKNRIS